MSENRNKKIEYFNKHKDLYKLINVALNNVICVYQLRDLMFSTNYISNNSEFDEFLRFSEKYDLLKCKNNKKCNISTDVLIARDYVVQAFANKKVASYSYKTTDAITSYYKMFFLLEHIKENFDIEQAPTLEKFMTVACEYTTFAIEKSQTQKLYQDLKNRNMLNVDGEIRLNELNHLEDYKIFTLPRSSKNEKTKKIDSKFTEEYVETITNTSNIIKNNKHYYNYNLGKISDNKSYVVYFNINAKNGFKKKSNRALTAVKFDVSGKFKTSEIADYSTKIIESARKHIGDELQDINLLIYLSDEKKMQETFNHCFSRKINSNGVSNYDSNFTARVRETSRKVYNTKILRFTEPVLNTEEHSMHYKLYYTTKKEQIETESSEEEQYYNINIFFKYANVENDLYNAESLKEKEELDRQKRKRATVVKYAQDDEFMEMLKEHLEYIRKS